MSILWSIKRARELAERRKKQHQCKRCGLFYPKTSNQCPRCSELGDLELKQLLKQIRNERITIGRYMFTGIFVILILLYLAS